MRKKIPTILIFGPPGSGKGTMSDVICSFNTLLHLSSGDVFRSLNRKSKLGLEVQSYLNTGKLIPDTLTMQICTEHIQSLINQKEFNPNTQKLLLDGLPRTLQQAKLLDEITEIKRIIILDIQNKNELIKRLKRRFITSQRKDDADENIIIQRFEEYTKKTIEVLNHYDKNLQSKVNAQQNPFYVLEELIQKNKDYLL